MAKRVISQGVKQIICICMVAIVLAPIILTLFASLKTKTDMVNTSPLLLPSFDRITFDNYKEVLTDKQLLTGFKNTGIILAVSLVFNVLFGTITAYIIERFVPLLAPATATVCIIKAISIINDMYIPYLYMPKNKLRTLTTFLMDYANAQLGSWQTLAAGIIIIMIPTVILYLIFQKHILAGVAAGAVKE